MRLFYVVAFVVCLSKQFCYGAKVLLVLKSQANISQATNIKTRVAKSTYIYNTLYNHAQATQQNIVAYLNSQSLPHRSYYLVNMIHTDLNGIQIDSMEKHPDILSIIPDGNFTLPIIDRSNHSRERAIEWGLNMIQAPAVWAKGFTGQGIIVGGQDTGYDWDHPALINKYRGWNGVSSNHDYNWHDAIHTSASNPCGVNSTLPCDDNNHGTHTMGTMIGDDGMGNQIGVAPGARWMGCRNMNNGDGTLSTYLECFEWFLAPYPVGSTSASGDPSQGPNVINNSWACPPSEGCNITNFAVMEQAVNTLKAAGIVVVVSTGNEGSACGTVKNPPAIFENSFSVGSTTSNDVISSFSSRGPVTIDGSNRIKPNVTAPGSNVRSAINGGGYASYNGTSMAGPHVAGLVALLLSARPDLDGEVEKIESIIEYTAVRKFPTVLCSDTLNQFPNNTYGWGRIDALATINFITENTLITKGDLHLAEIGNTLILTSPNGTSYSIGIDGSGNPITLMASTNFANSTKLQNSSLYFVDTTKSVVLSTPTGNYKLKVVNGALTAESVASPSAPLVSYNGNIEIATPLHSLIVKSPTGLVHAISVENNGVLTIKNIPAVD